MDKYPSHRMFRYDISKEPGIVTPCCVYEYAPNLTDLPSKHVKAKAVWDTGADRSVVNPRIITELGLKPHTVDVSVTLAGGREAMADLFEVVIRLPNNCDKRIMALVVRDANESDDVLIGMDVICDGDFIVRGGKIFTFCDPPIPVQFPPFHMPMTKEQADMYSKTGRRC